MASLRYSAAEESEDTLDAFTSSTTATEASLAQEATEKDNKFLTLIQERKMIAKREKERIREVSKKIKKMFQRKQKEDNTRKDSEDLGESQRNKEHISVSNR